MDQNISGVILAGGTNRRFHGITKANLIINGKSIISRIVDTFSNIFDEIIIVTNTPEEFSFLSNLIIVNDLLSEAGPLGGIHAALKASSKDAVFVVGGDMPLIDKGLITNQIDFYNSGKYDIVVPRVNDLIEPLHSIYNSTLVNTLEEYLKSGRDYAVRDFFGMVNVCYMPLELTELTKNAFININSSSDILYVGKILGKE